MGKLAVLMLTGLMFAAPAAAGTLYRCVGADGIPNYSSKRVSNAVCKAMSTGAGAGRVSRSSASKAPPAKPVPVATPAVDTGASTTAASAGATKQVVFSTSDAAAPAKAPKAGGGTRVLRGAVYRFERDGVTHYTNVRPRGAAQSKLLFSYVETCYACGLMANVNFGSVRLNTSAYSSEIRDAASRFGVDEYIVRAIIHAESAYRPNAISHAGAQGLMQLIPATASRFGVSDPFDPAQNISGGVKYLAWLMKRYSSNLTLVAAAYNAGEGAVDRNGGVPPYSETQRYVQRVGQLADRYRSALANN
ncbi:MAG: transglycosylase [Gammaproteobacteria bacterium RIFCSPHIGHO2_12_FULL_63_22]|nr:MAG: transglycosylase [Gammaproteobacteria bacterium RIFCSPHIGHO2_12_FULL_63_22]